jgi:outer membrane receptor protein involved in Fe transport
MIHPARTCIATVLVAVVIPGVTLAQHPERVVANDNAMRRLSVLPERYVDVDLRGVSLKVAIEAIAALGRVDVSYPLDAIEAQTSPVTLRARGIVLDDAFRRILAGTSLRMTMMPGKRFAVVPSVTSDSLAVRGTVVGRVIEAGTGQPVSGATVSIDGATRGVVTNGEGGFRLTNVSTSGHTVTVRRVGFQRASQTVTVPAGQSVTMTFRLEPSASTLDQVIVTGTVIPTELKAVPNAITVITAKQIESRGITRIEQLFRGDVPGLFAQSRGSAGLTDEVLMFSRGGTALSASSAGTSDGTNPIKTYVDGVEMADPQYLSQIDPKSIERIEILTGPQASTIYGSNALNGVMQIFTKRGATSAPQLTLQLLSGWVENNYSDARTPQHDYSGQVTGIDGRVSYNAGGSWVYVGPWTPAKQTTRVSAFGGTRMAFTTRAGHITSDFAFRRGNTMTQKMGNTWQGETAMRETGLYRPSTNSGFDDQRTFELNGQTVGLTTMYAPTSWWSHELNVGDDFSDREIRSIARVFKHPGDSALWLSHDLDRRRSLRYSTTTRAAITSAIQLTAAFGADTWREIYSTEFVTPQSLNGPLSGENIFLARQVSHNTGAFVQTQLTVLDQLFLTYGLRAEWNPNLGKEAIPNYAPRFGAALTRSVGAITAKVRASYGRSTRPPTPRLQSAQSILSYGYDHLFADYGNFDMFVANPLLTPESQQGGEGGLELYLGTRASFVVTRYNQTVDGLIERINVDSVRSLAQFPTYYEGPLDTAGYGYQYQAKYLHIGSIRNQGWELQGTLNLGPFATRGTYSWTKSRVIGITPMYRSYFATASNVI